MDPERCAECGFDATLLTTADAITSLRSLGRRWRESFGDSPEDVLRRRPAPEVWSSLEYAGHTRDVLALIGYGLEQILDDTRPTFPAIESAPDAPDHGYNALDADHVLAELEANAERMAVRAERALPQHWSRTATIGDREVDAGWLIRHAVHDATHHLRDVEHILGRS